MQQHYLIRHLSGILLLLTLIGGTALMGQSGGELAQLYLDNRIDRLAALNDGGKIAQSDWRVFIAALFEAEAESATEQMMQVYSQTTDRTLQELVRQRVARFYAARGYYETARRIETDSHFFNNLVNFKENGRGNAAASETAPAVVGTPVAAPPAGEYGIQVGAFSGAGNARSLKDKLETNYPNISVVKKVKNGNDLFVVVVSGYSSREDAEAAVREINKKFELRGYIIQF